MIFNPTMCKATIKSKWISTHEWHYNGGHSSLTLRDERTTYMRGGRLVLVVYLSKDSSLYPRDGTLNLNDVEISTRDSVSLPREEKQI